MTDEEMTRESQKLEQAENKTVYTEPEYTVCCDQPCEVVGHKVTHYQYRDGTRWCIDYGCKGCDRCCRYSIG